MNTNSKTTYILLDRGTEDKELLGDINRIFSDLGEPSIKNIAVRYPKLLEFKQYLQDEVEMEASA
jgi:hypothetical protein